MKAIGSGNSNNGSRNNNRNSADGRVVSNHGRRKVNPLSPPTTVDLGVGVKVHFPFTPYECQETYMRTVLHALLKSENALLESPTGTGKTLCLLCSTLAWQRQQSRLLRQASELTGSNNNANSSSQVSTSTSTTQQQQQQQQQRVPTIIYASRTHSQLSQVVRELRNTRYRPQHAVLGSREQMCIHPKIKTQAATSYDINHGCSRLGKDRKCRYRNNLEGFVPPSNDSTGGGCGGVGGATSTQPVLDLEDLVTMGKTSKVCPFYYTRGQIENAELILVPYNYLFDKDARQTTLADVPWNNAVVIFDEAHNLESFASESASFDLSSTDIAGCVSDISRAINYVQAAPDVTATVKLDNMIKLKAMFLKLEDYILHLGPQTAYSGEYMIDILTKSMCLNHANHEIFIQEVQKINEFLADMRGGSSNGGAYKLDHFVQCIKRVYGYSLESRCLAKAAMYRVHVSPPQKSTTNGNSVGRTISYWCFAPSLAMEELANLNVRSILVTSGTLSPLPSYSLELGLDFKHTLENPHIIRKNQIHVQVVGKGVCGKLLSSAYERRQDKEYYFELGNTIISLAKVTPAGMLIFFPSYSVMETCIEEWGGPISSKKRYENSNNFFAAKKKKESSNNKRYSFPFAPVAFSFQKQSPAPWNRLLAVKSVVLEPRSSADLIDAMNEFSKFLSKPKSTGCILMGVCRGKISEGIDFSNEQSRAVVITGLPFPPSFDPKVKMKKEFLDKARVQANSVRNAESIDCGFDNAIDEGRSSNTNTKMKTLASSSNLKLSGQEWYTQQAHRAVNQAIGRVIRNQHDYGAVLLLDARFDQPRNQIGLSKWLQPYIQKDQGFGPTVSSLKRFYNTAKTDAEVRDEETKRARVAAEAAATEEAKRQAYDDEGTTKVAFVKAEVLLAPTGDDEAQSAGCNSVTYVAPKQILGRLDVGQPDGDAKVRVQQDTPLIQQNMKQNKQDSIFDTKSRVVSSTSKKTTTNNAAVNDSKRIAIVFMSKVKSNLSVNDQSVIRKAIVALKQAGEAKDVDLYLRYARRIIRMVNRCDCFDQYTGIDDNQRMMFLFFGLLPSAYKDLVEKQAFDIIVKASRFLEVCLERVGADNIVAFQSAVSCLVYSVWRGGTTGSEVPIDEYLRTAKPLLTKILVLSASTDQSTVSDNFLRLIPARLHMSTRALISELVSRRNISRLKEIDKNSKGEHTVNSKNFKFHKPWLDGEMEAVQASPDNTAVNKPSANSAVLIPQKRAVAIPSVTPQMEKTNNPYVRKGSENAKYSKTPNNPYARKKSADSTDGSTTKKAKSENYQQSANRNSLGSYIRSVANEPFVTKRPSDIVKGIVSTASGSPSLASSRQRKQTCPVCSKICVEPYISDCGHVACMSCWSSWLQRSSSCMSCRKPTTKSSLARVVYGSPQTLQRIRDGAAASGTA